MALVSPNAQLACTLQNISFTVCNSLLAHMREWQVCHQSIRVASLMRLGQHCHESSTVAKHVWLQVLA